MRKILILILIILITDTSFSAVRINKGEKAKFTGILTTEKEFNGMVKDIKLGDLNKEVIEHYKNLTNIQKTVIKQRTEQLGLVRNMNDKLSDRLESTERYSNLQKTVWFVLGVITTSLAVKLGRDI